MPIRLRLTLAFVAVLTVVLSATGGLLYLSFAAELRRAVDRGLEERTAALSAVLSDGGLEPADAGVGAVAVSIEDFGQVLTSSGAIVATNPQLGSRRLLTDREVARARRGTIMVNRSTGLIFPKGPRIRATPIQAEGRRLIVVVAASMQTRHEALEHLGALLLVGLPAALALASVAGYGVAAAALRPVEAMRREAAVVSLTDPGRRLPVPPARDEISRLGETLNDMLERQEAAFARERTFVDDASHELRTPLAVLKTELELALRHQRSRQGLELALRSAAEETDRLVQLAEDLLVVARSSNGRLPLRREDVGAVELLDRVRSRFAHRGAEEGRAIDVDGPAELRLAADPLRLEQALGNLVDNALRHGSGALRLGAARRNGTVELHVVDEGRGFPPDFLPGAFDRFSRADAARPRGGAGLGLAIVEAIALAHRGRARAQNPPSGGADVWLELPAGTLEGRATEHPHG